MCSTTHRLTSYRLLNFAYTVNESNCCIPESSAKIHCSCSPHPQIPSSPRGNKSSRVSFVFDSLLVPKGRLV